MSLLYGGEAAAFVDSGDIHDAQKEKESFQGWIRVEPIGTAHNFIRFIHRSDQRRDSFREVQTELLRLE
jgi:hypothetical protein